MYRQRALFFGLLGAALAAGCGGNVILDSGGGSGAASTGSGGGGVGGAGVGGAGVGGAGVGESGTTSSGPSGPGISCDITTDAQHFCLEYFGIPSGDLAAVQSECMTETGTFGTSCPSAGRLGTCALVAGGLSYSESFYDSNSFTAAEAQQACTASGGTWTAD